MNAEAIKESLTLAASVCDLVGALLLANSLISHISIWQVPKYLVSALIGTVAAKDLTGFGGSHENHLKSLRGLAFIALGFLIHVGTAFFSIGPPV